MTAVSIHIRSEARHKLVIRAGGVNVAVPTNTSNLDISTRSSQDYFVSPAQSRVDGFTIKPGQGQVRQFVLKNPGSGYVCFLFPLNRTGPRQLSENSCGTEPRSRPNSLVSVTCGILISLSHRLNPGHPSRSHLNPARLTRHQTSHRSPQLVLQFFFLFLLLVI